MRVAFLVNEFPAISETFVLDQLTGLVDRGCEVDVFAQRLHPEAVAHPAVKSYGLLARASALTPPNVSSKGERLLRGVLDVSRALTRPGRASVLRSLDARRLGLDALKLKPFYRVLPFQGRAGYDIVNCHFGPNGVLGVGLRELGAFSAPVVTHFHGYDATEYVQMSGKDVYRRLFAEGDRFACVSRRIASRLVELGCSPEKILIQRTGTRVSAIEFKPREPVPGEPLDVLSVGRLVEKKGIEFALRAVALLVERGQAVRYSIIGDGPERARLTELARELGIERHATFLGAKPRGEVEQAMRAADVLLAPSVTARSGDEEGVPVVLMEALASGLPVVSTRHAGIPELIEHGVTGLLADERDAPGLAEQLVHLAGHPDERRALTAAGRRVVERDYDVDALNKQLFETFERLLGRRPWPPASARLW